MAQRMNGECNKAVRLTCPRGRQRFLAAAILITVSAHAAPTFPAPPPNTPAEGGLTPRLLGADLIQNGDHLDPQDPIRPDAPLYVDLQWLFAESAPTPTTLVFRFSSFDLRVVRDIHHEVAPEADVAPGSVWRERVTIDIDRIAYSMSGEVQLAIARQSAKIDSDRLDPLLTIPFMLEPLVQSPGISRETATSLLGDDAILLPVSFRLGHAAQWESEPIGEPSGVVAAVALFSAFSYGDVKQGEPIGSIEITGPNGNKHHVTLLSGVHTARSDFDANPTARNHQKIRIAESTDAGYESQSGQPFERHKYIAIIDIPAGITAPVRLRIANSSRVPFDVYGIGLVRAQ